MIATITAAKTYEVNRLTQREFGEALPGEVGIRDPKGHPDHQRQVRKGDIVRAIAVGIDASDT